MRANPSIERICPGKPGQAAYVERVRPPLNHQ